LTCAMKSNNSGQESEAFPILHHSGSLSQEEKTIEAHMVFAMRHALCAPQSRVLWARMLYLQVLLAGAFCR
jgi:hypothetical protein